MAYQRKRKFVDPGFQGRLLVRLIVYWILYHLALWHCMFLVSLVGTGINPAPGMPAKSFFTLYREFAAEHVSVIVCFFALLPIFGRDMIRFSHRIAGPLVRFRHTMQSIADGKPVAPVSLRKYDLMSEFLGTFNRMVASWNARIGQAAPQEPDEEALALAESNS